MPVYLRSAQKITLRTFRKRHSAFSCGPSLLCFISPSAFLSSSHLPSCSLSVELRSPVLHTHTHEFQITTPPTYAQPCWLRVLKSRRRYANEHESCERSEGKGLAREKERGQNSECEPSGEKSTAQKHTLIIFLLCAVHFNLLQLLHTL